MVYIILLAPRNSYNQSIHPSIRPPTPSSPPTLAPPHLSRPLPPLPDKEAQAVRVGGEGDLGALGEVEDVAGDGVHLLPGLVLDVELALDDDLHLVVRVRVHERRALFQPVEAG